MENSTRYTIVAGDSFFWAGVVHATLAGVEDVAHLYPELFSLQERIRAQWNWKHSDKRVFVAAVDRASSRQVDLVQKARGAGAIIDAVDYRDYYPGIFPGGLTPVTPVVSGKQSETSGDREKSSVDGPRFRPTLAPRLNFLLGGIAARLGKASADIQMPGRAEILVMAHHFELKDALIELVQRGASVGIGFYRSLMEPRWEPFGLFGPKCPIKFFDLSPHLDEITTLNQCRRSASAESPRSVVSELF
jgi:hypothetical protein